MLAGHRLPLLEVDDPALRGNGSDMNMKTILSFLTVVAVTLGFCVYGVTQSDTQSLGAYARSLRKNASPAKTTPQVYDNDNLPKNSSLSVVGSETPDDHAAQAKSNSDEKKDAAQSGNAQADKDMKKPPQIKPGQSDDEREKAIAAWKKKLSDQKSRVDMAARDLDLTQREYQVKSSEFYANTALRVQNPRAFAEDDAKFKKEIAAKQKALDDAKAKLSDMQDEAHKQGVPNSVTE